MLYPVEENNTRWFSTYLMLVRALLLHNSIDIFVMNHRYSRNDEKNLGDCIMTTDDWNYCKEAVAFMRPFWVLTQELQGKDTSGKSN